MNVAVIGASNKEDRYSYKAVKLLEKNGHTVFPVHKRITEIEGIKVYSQISEIPQSIDTITFYVSADISSKMIDEVLKISPKRAIFNPGAENAELSEQLQKNNIVTLNACTLVLLNTNQF